MGWVAAGDGYEVSLAGGRIVCRTAAGKMLKAVPKSVREGTAVAGLRQLKEWLERHDRESAATVEDWLIRSLPVPAAVIAGVWPDPSWRAPLHDLVVAPVDTDGSWQLDRAGFLRDVDAAGRLGVLDLDGASAWLSVERVVPPHPVLLDELDDLREFAADLGVRQGVLQLFRETWARPEGAAALDEEAARYGGGEFAQLRHLTGRATSLGYLVRGGYVVRRLWERGRVVDARIWAGEGDPAQEAETGDLEFADADGGRLAPADVGPVAWSEGMRMAAALYAGRVVKEEAAA